MAQSRNPTVVHSAAQLPGEADLIAAVLANLRDEAPKMVYADWLEERGDPRGEHLRTFTLAARNKTNKIFPNGEAFPKVWRDVIGLTLIQRIREMNLNERENVLLELARPVLTIDSEPADEGDFPIGMSRFGGCPDLPSGAEWPTAKAREHPPDWDVNRKLTLRLLAQLNLADLAQTQAGRDLPREGLLSFFVNKIVEYSWVGLAAWKVLYLPDVKNMERLAPPKEVDENNPVSSPCKLTITESLDIPISWDPWEKKLDLGESGNPLRKAYRELESPGFRLPFNNQLLGYTHPATLAGDPINSTDWRHLATFVTNEEDLSWFWGDGDRLYFVISEENLRQQRFDDIRVEEG
jgi:uncharacterized protein (TIGR02996 family)